MIEFITDYWHILLSLFVIQGCFGILLVELSFYLMKRSIDVVEERDSQFPSWRRLDV